MKRISFGLILVFTLAACTSPSPTQPQSAIETAVAGTVAAQASPTPLPSYTPTVTPSPTIRPTKTFHPSTVQARRTPTKKPVESLEEIRADFIGIMVDVLERHFEIDRVNMARFDHGVFEMELYTGLAARDSQPPISYGVVQTLAAALADWEDRNIAALAGGSDFSFNLTTYSTDGDYRYQSETDLETLRKVNQRAISYEEWVEASGAGFR
jgi:hypothetical protein